MSRTDIILVEDDPLVGEISKDILLGGGYSVRLIQDSREAIPAITKSMPKLVITDIMMPGVSGLDICKSIKSAPALKDIKVMIVSAKSFDAEKRRAVMMGAAHFLTKPFTEKGLLAAVKDVLAS